MNRSPQKELIKCYLTCTLIDTAGTACRASARRSAVFRRNPSGTIRIPAASREVGDLIIDFDGGEISVDIENITHCHFTPYEASATYAANIIEDCAKSATEFVLSVLNDRRVLWRHPNGAGGSYEIGADHGHGTDAPLEGDDVEKFVWSGPYRDTN